MSCSRIHSRIFFPLAYHPTLNGELPAILRCSHNTRPRGVLEMECIVHVVSGFSQRAYVGSTMGLGWYIIAFYGKQHITYGYGLDLFLQLTCSVDLIS